MPELQEAIEHQLQRKYNKVATKAKQTPKRGQELHEEQKRMLQALADHKLLIEANKEDQVKDDVAKEVASDLLAKETQRQQETEYFWM